MKYFIIIFCLFFNILKINASHVPGGNISYECIAPNLYEITLTVFEDCGTAFIGQNSESISITNSCGIPFSNNINLPIFIYQQEVSQLLFITTTSECSGGNFPGFITCVERKRNTSW